MSTDARATIGLTGLATMGRNLARNIARHDHTIAVHNRTTQKMTDLVEEFGDEDLAYRRQVPMFIPRSGGWRQLVQRSSGRQGVGD